MKTRQMTGVRHLVSAALSLLGLGLIAACGAPVAPGDGVIRDLFSGDAIGVIDPDSGDYVFADGARVVHDLIAQVDQATSDELVSQVFNKKLIPMEPVILDDGFGDWDWASPPSGGGSSCTSSCWQFVENTSWGQVGCEGCCINEGGGFCTCWESCWDYSCVGGGCGGSGGGSGGGSSSGGSSLSPI